MSQPTLSTKQQPEPEWYEIRVQGYLHARWRSRFEAFTISREEDGQTVLSGPVVDQAALFGLLRQVRDLGLPLLSVNRLKR